MLLCPCNSPGKNTGEGYSLLQGIFLTQGLNLGLPHCRNFLYHLNCQGSPSSLNFRLTLSNDYLISQLGCIICISGKIYPILIYSNCKLSYLIWWHLFSSSFSSQQSKSSFLSHQKLSYWLLWTCIDIQMQLLFLFPCWCFHLTTVISYLDHAATF